MSLKIRVVPSVYLAYLLHKHVNRGTQQIMLAGKHTNCLLAWQLCRALESSHQQRQRYLVTDLQYPIIREWRNGIMSLHLPY